MRNQIIQDITNINENNLNRINIIDRELQEHIKSIQETLNILESMMEGMQWTS